jgi:PBP1b-binding outer membrane lipoprotein LpoB
LALTVPLSRFTSRVGGGSAFYVRHQHTIMKFTLLVLTLCLFLAGCSRHDAQLQKSVTGTWTNEAIAVSFLSDGTFTVRPSNPAHTNVSQGSWLVKDGALVCTMTHSTDVSGGITSVV